MKETILKEMIDFANRFLLEWKINKQRRSSILEYMDKWFLSLKINRTEKKEENWLVIEKIEIDDDYQSQGIGTAYLEQLRDLQVKGIIGVMVECVLNEKLMRILLKLGYSIDSINYQNFIYKYDKLIHTNPYLKDPIKRKKAIHDAVTSSTAIDN